MLPVQPNFQNNQVLFKDKNQGPLPGSEEELLHFKALQAAFGEQFEMFFPDNLAPKTIVVVPSLSLDQEVLEKVSASLHYEERLLCLLLLLRMPRTHITFVTSVPIDPIIIDYYLHLLPGITGYHARERLTLLCCYDTSSVSLTEKILQRRRLMERIRKSIPADSVAHLACFNITDKERTLAVQLGIPVYGCDPSLMYWGTKSGSRKIFLDAGVAMPPGAEDLKSYEDIVHAVSALKDMYPALRKAIIKLNDGFSGDGNAIIHYPENMYKKDLFNWIHNNLKKEIIPVAKDQDTDQFLQQFYKMQGIAEVFIEGTKKASPSVQCRINPLGEIDIISTHDQELGGESGQVFLGAHFPANPEYRSAIVEQARAIAAILQQKGVLGRFSIDFISVFDNGTWHHYAIEINLRKGGTTHPFIMLQFLTNGRYDEEEGLFKTLDLQPRYYYASDNVQNNQYKGLTPQDLMDIAIFHGLHFDSASLKGVVFHMIGALSQFGKMGIVCIGASPEEAYQFFIKTLEVLDKETKSA